MGQRILVVDDEQALRLLLKHILEPLGYTVQVAGDFREALRSLETASFDLILTDIKFGPPNGIDLLRELRRRKDRAYVILITGYPDVETSQEAVRLGAFDYLVKPVEQNTLLHAVRTALSHKEMRDAKERATRHLEAIFRSVHDGIITLDEQGRLLSFNEAATRLCGLTPDSLGKPFLPNHDRCHFPCQKAIHDLREARSPTPAHRISCHAEGRPLQIVELTSTPLLDEEGRLSGSVIVVKDVSRLAILEKHLDMRHRFHRLVGASRPMHRVFNLIESLANVDTTVLITGETGTGKELVAEAIHSQGSRAKFPLVKVNCAGLPETLLESELFGHVKGSFTGAIRDKPGRFELTGKGTIFLDEIGDISLRMQIGLLRVLQERECERVGGEQTIKVEARVVAATNQDLRRKVEEGTFRQDLYYRLKVVEVPLPPLRERREDIPLLLDHFLDIFNNRFEKKITGFTQRVLKILMEHAWPGNVRELEHVVEHAFVVCQQEVIDVEDLPPEIRGEVAFPTPARTEVVEDTERNRILRMLKESGWNKARAAHLLNMSRSTLYRRMHALEIPDEPDFGYLKNRG
ncbi:MAG: sigma 54-interacting transcriptional regulator [Magnetococcales bacterium]|nr:sigma 54-interacting transcriptional regulator [Magnetococcales bacterium]